MWYARRRQNVDMDLMGKSEGRRPFGRVICNGSSLGMWRLGMRYDKYILMGLRKGGGWN